MGPQNLTPLTKDVSIVTPEGFNHSLSGEVSVMIPGATVESIPYFIFPTIEGLRSGGIIFQMLFKGLLKFRFKYVISAGATLKIHKRDSDSGEWVEVLSATFNDDTETTEEIDIVSEGYLEIKITAVGVEAIVVPKEFHFLSESGKSFVETTTIAPTGTPSGYSKEYIVGVGFVWRPYWIV